MGPVAQLLSDGERLHLRHGPIDLIIGVDGERDRAFRAAWARFQTILDELVAELPLLRRDVGEMPVGGIARRMTRAALPHAPVFVTPMAAVAGAVAEEILAAMTEVKTPRRAYVNNGGDIAFHLGRGERFRMAIAGLDGQALGAVDVAADDPARGIATSGQGGRSFSLGIADAVTVLARTAAEADVAATMIANAVDLPGHPSVTRAPANRLLPESDLGARLVTTAVGALSPSDVARALDRGEAAGHEICARGLAVSAALFLKGEVRLVGRPAIFSPARSLAHA